MSTHVVVGANLREVAINQLRRKRAPGPLARLPDGEPFPRRTLVLHHARRLLLADVRTLRLGQWSGLPPLGRLLTEHVQRSANTACDPST